VLASSSVDALDPQTAELTLLVAAVADTAKKALAA